MKNKELGWIRCDLLDLVSMERVWGGGLWRGVARGGVPANYGKPVETIRLNFFLTVYGLGGA